MSTVVLGWHLQRKFQSGASSSCERTLLRSAECQSTLETPKRFAARRPSWKISCSLTNAFKKHYRAFPARPLTSSAPPQLPQFEEVRIPQCAPRPVAGAFSEMADATAFLAPTPVIQVSSSRRMVAPLRRPKGATFAVLDQPAVNPYLKKHSASIVRDYLTRRAVHNVLFYFTELGDSPSKRWLLRFEDFEAQEKNDTFQDGDAYLRRMLYAKPEKGVIVQRHPRGYFSRKFPFKISPFRIGSSILDSRQQLAAEWAVDLRCVEADNLEIQRMSFEKMFEKDERVLNSKRNLIFDCDVFSSNQSPMRYKNFQSLLVLVTQHAIARLQPYLRDTSNHEYMYLIQFVQRYGPLKDGDHFVQELMSQPLQERSNPEFIIDPRALAMHILDLRNVISKEWISVMEGVPEEQLTMKRSMLEHAADLPPTPGADYPTGSSNGPNLNDRN